MSTATAVPAANKLGKPKRPIAGIDLFELMAIGPAADGASQRVDRANRIIRRVKVLGLQSRNTGRVAGLGADRVGNASNQPYSYSPEAIRAAIPLFEGMTVRIDHPEATYKPSGERVFSSRDRKLGETFGRLVHCAMGDDGLYADLEYVESHPLSEMAIEMAERMPEKLCLSPNTIADLVVRNGRLVVERISAVKSVDLIGARGGTNLSLFETHGSSDMELATDDTQTTETSAADPVETVKNAFKEAVMQVLDDESLDEGAMISKVKEIIKAMNKAEEALSDEAPESSETEAEAATETTTAESAADLTAIREENRQLKARLSARELLESEGIPVNPALVTALAALPDEASRKALVASWPKGNGAAASAPKPRSATRLVESAADPPKTKHDIASPEEAIRHLRGRA